jgi:glycosyltransferase involved in cell wall biosynthesis
MYILIIAPETYPPVSAESIVTAKLIYSMQKRGVEIKVLHNPSGLELYPQGDNNPFSEIKQLLINPFPKTVQKLNLPSKLKLILWSFFTFSKGLQLIREKRPDLIMSRVMPIYGHLPALGIKVFWNIPWITNWSDPAPISISPVPYKKKTLMSNFWEHYCKIVFRKSDLVCFPNKFLEQHFLSHYPTVIKKTLIFPHIALSKLFFDSANSNTKLTVCHFGSLGLRSPETFIRALSKFVIDNPHAEIEVNFVGSKDSKAIELIDNLELNNWIKFIAPVSYCDSLKLMNQADILLIIEADTSIGIFLPSKVLDMIQSGKPILSISPKSGVLADLLEGDIGGIAVDRNNLDEIYEAINKLYAAWLDSSLLNRYRSSILRNRFNEDAVLDLFLSEVSSVIESKN